MHTIGILFKIVGTMYLEQDPRSGSFKNKSSLQKLLLSELADANLAEIFVGLEARWLI